MFGWNKANQEELQRTNEQLEKIVKETAEKGTVYEANTADIDNSRKQMKANMQQVSENHRSTEELAEQNIREETALADSLKELSGVMETAEKEYSEIVERIHEQTAECRDLVEENKHFTTPAKCINETPGELKNINHSCLELVDKIAEQSKQISVIALNAAIEAGRMGEGGIQFVEAAESMRRFAGNFDDLISEMRTLIALSDSKLTQMGEQSHRLVGLLKDNNVATGKLYKKNQRTEEMIGNASIRPYSPDVLAWREQLVGLRNTEEEILKIQKRNHIQVEDIQSEMDAQKKALQEITDELTPVLRSAKDQIQ